MAESQTATTMQDRLREYLQTELPQADGISVSDLHRAGTGSSRENWIFELTYREGGKEVYKKLILRRDAEQAMLKTDQETEYRVLKALDGNAPFPTPKPYWLDTTGKWLDRPFMVLQFYEGICDRAVLQKPALPIETRLKLARRYAEIMARTHALDWRSLGLDALGVPQGPYGAAKAELDRWQSLTHDPVTPQPVITETIYWLRKNMPRSDRIALVHGDFRPGNSLVLDGEINVMLDWELAHLGDPMEDIGWYTQPTHYDKEHFLAGLFHHKEFYELYSKITGLEIDEEAVYYYRVLAAFKIAANLVQREKETQDDRTGRSTIVPVDLVRFNGLLANLIGL